MDDLRCPGPVVADEAGHPCVGGQAGGEGRGRVLERARLERCGRAGPGVVLLQGCAAEREGNDRGADGVFRCTGRLHGDGRGVAGCCPHAGTVGGRVRRGADRHTADRPARTPAGAGCSVTRSRIFSDPSSEVRPRARRAVEFLRPGARPSRRREGRGTAKDGPEPRQPGPWVLRRNAREPRAPPSILRTAGQNAHWLAGVRGSLPMTTSARQCRASAGGSKGAQG